MGSSGGPPAMAPQWRNSPRWSNSTRPASPWSRNAPTPYYARRSTGLIASSAACAPRTDATGTAAAWHSWRSSWTTSWQPCEFGGLPGVVCRSVSEDYESGDHDGAKDGNNGGGWEALDPDCVLVEDDPI